VASPGGRSRGLCAAGFPVGCATPVTMAGFFASVSSPRHLDPCMRFSRTRLTDAVHRLAFGFSRQSLKGLGATTVPDKETNPRWSGDW
jgi:hypothetical protein